MPRKLILSVVISLIVLDLTSCRVPPATAAKEPNKPAVEVFYLANEGFFITGGGKKVLVDALFREGIKPYAVVSPTNKERLEQARDPFSDVDLTMASHFHSDHFDPLAVATHLHHNPRALFVSTNQAFDKFKAVGALFEEVKTRVRAAMPNEGERIKLTHNGIHLQVLHVHHGRNRPIENLGLLFEIAGQKLFHIGDSEATAEDFKINNLLAERIDIAFLPFWYLLDEGNKQAVRAQIKARHIILMHIPPPDENDEYIKKRGGWATVLGKMKAEFPNTVWFRQEMEKKVFN
ncbi:MAG: MBL fold metallo-hydrolase [Blastocatellia bacterium]|nr:MBL fold metallo-hydrolase [Blastocatellia bacterium]